MKKILKNVFELLIIGVSGYIIINWPLYLLYLAIGLVVIFVLHIIHVVNILTHNDDILFKNVNINNVEYFITDLFKYNRLSRMIAMTLTRQLIERQDISKGENTLKYENISKYLNILDIESNVDLTSDIIKKAWKEQAKIYHPDKFETVEEKKIAQEKFISITESKDILLNHIKEK